MNEDQFYQLALYYCPGVGDIAIKHLIGYFGNAQEVFKSNKSKLKNVPGIGYKIIESITSKNTLAKAEKELKNLEQLNIDLLFFTDRNYPTRLKEIPDAPPLLFFKGNCDLNALKTIAIVGTRRATHYGKDVVQNIINQLRKHQVLIISGLAYGIDICAHRAAVEVNLPTLGVLGSGIDVVYPAVHKKTALEMLDKGGLITEQPSGAQPDAHNFPARNRIIAGLADAIIIVEAAARGGALITAEIANSYNKDVFAIPGSIFSEYSRGCNHLIRNHKANILTAVEDLEYLMNWNPDTQNIIKPDDEFVNLNEREKSVVKILRLNEREMLIDDLSWKSQIPINQLASVLLNLEFQGLIKALPGRKFRLANLL